MRIHQRLVLVGVSSSLTCLWVGYLVLFLLDLCILSDVLFVCWRILLDSCVCVFLAWMGPLVLPEELLIIVQLIPALAVSHVIVAPLPFALRCILCHHR